MLLGNPCAYEDGAAEHGRGWDAGCSFSLLMLSVSGPELVRGSGRDGKRFGGHCLMRCA
jgi:hypothetical protein